MRGLFRPSGDERRAFRSEMRGQARRRRRKRENESTLPASAVRFHGEASRSTASDPLRQTRVKIWRTFRGTSVRAGVVLQLSSGAERLKRLWEKERRESVGEVEERWRIVRGLRIMAQSHGAVLSEDVLRGRREPRPDCLFVNLKAEKYTLTHFPAFKG